MDVGTREITVTWQVLSSQQYHVRFVPTGSVSPAWLRKNVDLARACRRSYFRFYLWIMC